MYAKLFTGLTLDESAESTNDTMVSGRFSTGAWETSFRFG